MAGDQPGVSFPTLVMNGGPLDGTEYPLPLTGKPITLGSSMDADVQILLGNIEAAHASIVFTSGELVLSDAGSATGTFVNGEKVEADRVLQDGDRICLGPPGAKGSAKLLLRLPSSGAGTSVSGVSTPDVRTASAAPALAAHDAAPALHDAGEARLLGDDAGVVEAGLELSASENALFSAPLPPPPRAPEPVRPAPAAIPLKPVEAPAAPAPIRVAPPAPAPRSTPPTVAPPPPAPAPPPPPPRTSRPEYTNELPSIGAGEASDASGRGEFPSLRLGEKRATTGATSKGRQSARRRSLVNLPSLPIVPVAGGLAAVALLAGVAWFTLLRKTPPQPGPAQGPAPASRDAAEPAAAAARDEATVVEPDVALPGQTILIRGKGLTGKVSVLVAGMPASSVEASAEGVRAVVPDVGLPEGVKTTVTVRNGVAPARSFDLTIGRLPLVESLSPETGPVGETLTIRGRGFVAEPRANAVTVAGQRALVVGASTTELKVVVPPPPAGELNSELPVVVAAAGRTSSSGRLFQLARGATSGFRPRFFGAIVGEYPREDLAFVSTEIGPVLLLAGHAGGPAAADRALAAAAALNAVVDAAPDRLPAFEVRERPEPAVALVGAPRPLLVPVAEDVAAYAKPWESGKGPGRHVSTAAIARHWCALLKDYLGLFLERQRPLQLVALSPHARVLSDIYAEAGRRSPGERTVPTSVVLPPSASMAAALQKTALVVFTEAGRASVAVEGVWQGRIEDPDRGPQAFQAQLRASGSRLGGTLMTTAGSIEVRTPLREVAFERGSVRFTADLQGAACHFKGTLDGNNVSGTVERAGKPAMRFAMQFVE